MTKLVPKTKRRIKNIEHPTNWDRKSWDKIELPQWGDELDELVSEALSGLMIDFEEIEQVFTNCSCGRKISSNGVNSMCSRCMAGADLTYSHRDKIKEKDAEIVARVKEELQKPTKENSFRAETQRIFKRGKGPRVIRSNHGYLFHEE